MITTAALQLINAEYTIGLVEGLAIAGAAGSLFNLVKPDRRAEILEQVQKDRRQFTERIRRISRGQFSGPERRAIEQGSEATISRISSAIGQRGVIGPARQQIVARARQEPFLRLQQAALGQEGASLAQQEQLALAQPDETGGFFQDLGRISNAFFTLQGLQEGRGAVQQDQLLNDTVDFLFNQLGRGQGFDIQREFQQGAGRV